MLKLSKRSCKIGTSLNGRTQFEGDEEPKAIDFTLTNIALTPEELNTLCKDQAMADRLYVRDGKKFGAPTMGIFKSLTLGEKIEEGNVTLYLGTGDKNTLKLTSVKLAKISLTCELGGTTSMECQVQCKPKLDGSIGRLLDKLNRQVQVAIEVDGYGEQQDAFQGTTYDTKAGKNGDATSKATADKTEKPKRSHKKKPTSAPAVSANAPSTDTPQ